MHRTFVNVVLSALGFIFLVAGLSETARPGNGFFEVCKIIIPLITTFVIGFYFGSSK